MNFTATDWFTITGRGQVACVDGIPGLDPRPLPGRIVTIDGDTYKVMSVEMFGFADALGRPFNLLVQPA